MVEFSIVMLVFWGVNQILPFDEVGPCDLPNLICGSWRNRWAKLSPNLAIYFHWTMAVREENKLANPGRHCKTNQTLCLVTIFAFWTRYYASLIWSVQLVMHPNKKNKQQLLLILSSRNRNTISTNKQQNKAQNQEPTPRDLLTVGTQTHRIHVWYIHYQKKVMWVHIPQCHESWKTLEVSPGV